jgi:hypothetical protein
MKALEPDRRRRSRRLMNLGLVITWLVQVQAYHLLDEEGNFLVDCTNVQLEVLHLKNNLIECCASFRDYFA